MEDTVVGEKRGKIQPLKVISYLNVLQSVVSLVLISYIAILKCMNNFHAINHLHW